MHVHTASRFAQQQVPVEQAEHAAAKLPFDRFELFPELINEDSAFQFMGLSAVECIHSVYSFRKRNARFL